MNEQTREKGQQGILDLFVKATNLPISLFEYHNGSPQGLVSVTSLDRYEEHCNLIGQFPGGMEACNNDQCNRAGNAFQSGTEGLSCCHAGLWNQTSPIIVDEEVKAVLLYGETLIDDQEHMRKSLIKHEQTVKDLGLTDQEADQLLQSLLGSKKHPPAEFEDYKASVTDVVRYFYTLIREEEQQKKSLEKAVHELQTRLQPIISLAENMMVNSRSLTSEDTRQKANKMLNRAEALATIISNLGDFQQAYKFEKERIKPLFIEAWRIYSDESSARQINLEIDLHESRDQDTIPPISKIQFQLAVNNLIHNAVKYSFNGDYNRPRFVRVSGRPEKYYYRIEISNYGIGIKEKEITEELIFQDGYQGELTFGESRTGSGKGLTYVKKVIDRHHGQIKVTSKPLDEKSESLFGKPHLNFFTIYLPYEQADME